MLSGKRRSTVIAATAGLAVAGLLVGAAGAVVKKRIGGQVSLNAAARSAPGANDEVIFWGRVTSRRVFCRRGREIQIRMIDGATRRTIAKTRSGRRGGFIAARKLKRSDLQKAGVVFRARAVRKRVVRRNGNLIFICRPRISNAVSNIPTPTP